MRTIIVPTDFSLIADNALKYAIPVAEKENAKIVLVHAFKIDPVYSRVAFPTYFIEDEIISVQRRADHHLKASCEWIKKDHNVECDYISMLGGSIDVIKKVAKKLKPDLVIMGTKGANSFSDNLIGSTTARTIGKVNCPVIAVPAAAKYHGIQKIVYAMDFQQKDTYTFRKLKELTTLFPAHISIVHIYDGVDIENQKSVLHQFKGKADKKLGKNISYRFIADIDVNGELLKIAKNKHYDMLVMTTHKRSFFESLYNRSVTKKITNSIQIPLLAFRSH